MPFPTSPACIGGRQEGRGLAARIGVQETAALAFPPILPSAPLQPVARCAYRPSTPREILRLQLERRWRSDEDCPPALQALIDLDYFKDPGLEYSRFDFLTLKSYPEILDLFDKGWTYGRRLYETGEWGSDSRADLPPAACCLRPGWPSTSTCSACSFAGQLQCLESRRTRPCTFAEVPPPSARHMLRDLHRGSSNGTEGATA